MAVTYRILSLKTQVEYGGFMQYFDNGQGMYAYKVVNDLVIINAPKPHQLLKEALQIINPQFLEGKAFNDYVDQQQYQTLDLSALEQLDNAYYALQETESLEALLADYLRE